MAGRLTVEVDEDVQLVDNAVAASLLSPSVWVQRPPCMAGAHTGRLCLHAIRSPMEQQVAPLRLNDPSTDPELAYLHVRDDAAERERAQQDAEHLAALEEAHVRIKEQNLALEAHLNSQMAGVKEVLEENVTIKQLLAALQVRKEDFMVDPNLPPAAQAAAMQAAGLRLIANLCQQQQQAAAMGPPHQQQQQEEQEMDVDENGDQQQAPGVASSPTDTALPDVITPAAKAGPSSCGQACGQQQQQQQQPGLFLGGVQQRMTPTSPYDFPAEAQIAAAALTMTEGDPAEALVALLDKAMAGRRQHATSQLPAGM